MSKSVQNTSAKLLILFAIGGAIYSLIEIAWRGYTHISMFIAGGICFVLVGGINNFFPWSLGIIQQTLMAAFFITLVELIAGLVVNVRLGLGVWDYSGLPFNFMGQISLLYSLLWMPLALFAIFLDDWLRFVLFDEKKPHYTIV